jgi:hypothetical protein
MNKVERMIVRRIAIKMERWQRGKVARWQRGAVPGHKHPTLAPRETSNRIKF